MITKIEHLPENMLGFTAEGEITESDFTQLVMPEVNKFIEEHGKLNYMFVVKTSLKNFTMGAWFKDAIMGLKHLTKWNRAAIVSEVDTIRNFTDAFSLMMPGEFKGFAPEEMDKAIAWTSEQK